MNTIEILTRLKSDECFELGHESGEYSLLSSNNQGFVEYYVYKNVQGIIEQIISTTMLKTAPLCSENYPKTAWVSHFRNRFSRKPHKEKKMDSRC